MPNERAKEREPLTEVCERVHPFTHSANIIEYLICARCHSRLQDASMSRTLMRRQTAYLGKLVSYREKNKARQGRCGMLRGWEGGHW